MKNKAAQSETTFLRCKPIGMFSFFKGKLLRNEYPYLTQIQNLPTLYAYPDYHEIVSWSVYPIVHGPLIFPHISMTIDLIRIKFRLMVWTNSIGDLILVEGQCDLYFMI